ncbi:MAG: hypothetical protein NWS36_01765, partial [Burkholderiaceae bacterium]|nr:hypothetical protein [Burkholderiaceae bacterium]
MSTHSAYTSSAPTQNLQLGQGFIYGKFIEIELNGLYDPFLLTELDGASFYVSKTLQADGSDSQINVAEAWVNGESLLLVLDSADIDSPSNWSATALQDSNFNVST